MDSEGLLCARHSLGHSEQATGPWLGQREGEDHSPSDGSQPLIHKPPSKNESCLSAPLGHSLLPGSSAQGTRGEPPG